MAAAAETLNKAGIPIEITLLPKVYPSCLTCLSLDRVARTSVLDVENGSHLKLGPVMEASFLCEPSLENPNTRTVHGMIAYRDFYDLNHMHIVCPVYERVGQSI